MTRRQRPPAASSAIAPRGPAPISSGNTMALRRPPALASGDRVALISPSSHQGDASPGLRQGAVRILAGWGLEVANAREEEPRHLYLAGSDAQRAEQFQRLYRDPGIKALFFTRGGYGAARILPLLDGGHLATAPPKLVVGFSDATALFAYLHAVVGISVVHGPCIAAAGFLSAPPMEEELQALRRALFEPLNQPQFAITPLGKGVSGTADVEGAVLGGALSVLVTTLGTPWEIDTRDAILFLEDIGESPYRIDRMATHLRAAGKLAGLQALVLGRFYNCGGEPAGLLDEVLLDLFGNAPFPVVRGLSAGHGAPNLAFPLGQRARLTVNGAAGKAGACLAFI